MSLYRSSTSGESPSPKREASQKGDYRGAGMYPSRGMSADAIDAAQEKARQAVLPLKVLFDHHDYIEIEKLAERLEIERLQGRMTQERRAAWDRLVLADVRATQRSDRAAKELLQAVNKRLCDELPTEASFLTLQNSDVGHHVQFARAAIAWHHRRIGEETSAKAGRGYIGKARGDRVPPQIIIEND